MKLKCTATISTVYWKSNEESVQGSGFNAFSAPVSESRGRTSGKFHRGSKKAPERTEFAIKSFCTWITNRYPVDY